MSDLADIEPTIVDAALVAGHDGAAEVSVTLRYPNGAARSFALPLEAVEAAIDAQGVTTLYDLVGRPWSILIQHLS